MKRHFINCKQSITIELARFPRTLVMSNMISQKYRKSGSYSCFSRRPLYSSRSRDQKIRATRLQNIITGEELIIEAEQVINATGAWAGVVAGLAGATIDIIYSKGSLIVTHNRITERDRKSVV